MVAPAVVAVVFGVLAGVGAPPALAMCENEALRTGRSASLPDCRAYELVTPKELGSAGSADFPEESAFHALPSHSGDQLAIQALGVYLEPGASVGGTQAVFARTPQGWIMTPVPTPGVVSSDLNLELFSPDLSQVGFDAIKSLARHEASLQFGPVGGPYVTAASVSGSESELVRTQWAGANAGTSTEPAFSAVVFGAYDHALLPPGPEREVAEQMAPGARGLYEWANGRLRLVNVDNEGKLLSPCGADLGRSAHREGDAVNAVSDDGTRVIFTSPSEAPPPGCAAPELYMRVDGVQTVEVSAPEGVSVPKSERAEVTYVGASKDGSRIFFVTATALTPNAGAGFHLYEYQIDQPGEHRLTLIGNVAAQTNTEVNNPNVVVSEDGLVVYYDGAGGIWRYDTATATTSFVADPVQTFNFEPEYPTPNGEYLLFPSGNRGLPGPMVMGPHGLEEERRGAGHEEVYRYSALDGSVTCVSCGEGVAPAKGDLRVPESRHGAFSIDDGPAGMVSMSADGRRVFFQTSAKLLPQDTNEDSPEEEAEGPESALAPWHAGGDVYEWEQAGTEEEPGIFCRTSVGCTHLISTGEAVGPERFLGASLSGNDVFFTSAAELAPGATPSFSNIYDARVGGGFPPQPEAGECTSCQGVGRPAPSFGASGSETFAGAGNPVATAPPPPLKPKPKPKARCRRGFKWNRKGRCVRAASHRLGGRR